MCEANKNLSSDIDAVALLNLSMTCEFIKMRDKNSQNV